MDFRERGRWGEREIYQLTPICVQLGIEPATYVCP